MVPKRLVRVLLAGALGRKGTLVVAVVELLLVTLVEKIVVGGNVDTVSVEGGLEEDVRVEGPPLTLDTNLDLERWTMVSQPGLGHHALYGSAATSEARKETYSWDNCEPHNADVLIFFMIT